MRGRFIGLFLIVLLFSACSKSTPSPQVSPLRSPLSSGYDSPIVTPAVAHSGDLVVRPFSIDKPVMAGATHVKGSGPPGVPIILADLTFAGQVLAFTTVDSEGKFVFETGEPLKLNHRVGIMIGDLTGTKWQRQDFDERFHGDEARTVPQIGFYFDTCLVAE